MNRQLSLLVTFGLCVGHALTASAERRPFERVFNIEKVRAQNLDVEVIAETGDVRIYYRDSDGSVTSLVYVPSNKLDATVSTSIEELEPGPAGSGSQPQGQRMYRYRYGVENGEGSAQLLYTFVVEMTVSKATPISSLTPDDWYFRRTGPEPSTPNWVRWAGKPYRPTETPTYVVPGATIDGFALAAPGLPGILTAYARAAVSNSLNDAVEVEVGLRENCARGHVVGPVPVPSAFSAPSFAACIGEMYEQGAELGWVTDAQAAAPIREGLASVIDALEDGDSARARRSGEAVLADVRRLSTNDGLPTEEIITSEVVGLLTANVEYLLDRL